MSQLLVEKAANVGIIAAIVFLAVGLATGSTDDQFIADVQQACNAQGYNLDEIHLDPIPPPDYPCKSAALTIGIVSYDLATSPQAQDVVDTLLQIAKEVAQRYPGRVTDIHAWLVSGPNDASGHLCPGCIFVDGWVEL